MKGKGRLPLSSDCDFPSLERRSTPLLNVTSKRPYLLWMREIDDRLLATLKRSLDGIMCVHVHVYIVGVYAFGGGGQVHLEEHVLGFAIVEGHVLLLLANGLASLLI